MIVRALCTMVFVSGCSEPPLGSAGSTGSATGPDAPASAPSATPSPASEVALTNAPVAPAASSSASSSAARPIAEWLVAASDAHAWAHKKFTAEGVYRRTSLYQSGVYVGDEHPGIRRIVVHLADSTEAPAAEALQCHTELMAAPLDLRAGDRVRVTGTVAHFAAHGPRSYLPFLIGCTFTRL